MSRSTNLLRLLSAVSFMLLAASVLPAQQLPQYGSATHLGVKTCGNGTCHAAAQPWQDSAVLQNEFITWKNESAHSRAYRTLLNERSKRIANNLGLEKASTAEVCLSCHAGTVSKERQGGFFDIADGVGCESCHGGAENWLGQHVSRRGDHEDNLGLGMYPTDEPFFRARLCASCHVGTGEKSVIHRIYGAGHPRLVFELDTYSANQPAHYRVDSDYKLRKTHSNGLKLWAFGQVVSASFMLERLSDVQYSRDGMFPELSLFDCHACHRSITQTNAAARGTKAKRPGVPRLNDSNLIMLGILAEVIAPDLKDEILNGPRALHEATARGMEDVAVVARQLHVVMDSLLTRLEKKSFDDKTSSELLLSLIRGGRDGLYQDFADAEQATMAIASALAAGELEYGSPSSDLWIKVDTELEKFYEVTKTSEGFVPRDFQRVATIVWDKVQ